MLRTAITLGVGALALVAVLTLWDAIVREPRRRRASDRLREKLWRS